MKDFWHIWIMGRHKHSFGGAMIISTTSTLVPKINKHSCYCGKELWGLSNEDILNLPWQMQYGKHEGKNK